MNAENLGVWVFLWLIKHTMAYTLPVSKLPFVLKKYTVLSIERLRPNLKLFGNNPNLNIRMFFSRPLQSFDSTVQIHYLTGLTPGLN